MPPEEELVKELSYEKSIRNDERQKVYEEISNIARNKNQD